MNRSKRSKDHDPPVREDLSDAHASLRDLTHEAKENAFGEGLRRARDVAGYTQTKLARELGYDPSYISKLESGREPPRREIAERADEMLQQKGTLVALWRAYVDAHPKQRVQKNRYGIDYGVMSDHHAHRPGLIVVHEDSRLVYEKGLYKTRVRRELYNSSDAPITRYLIRVAVDRHPNSSQLSNALYRRRPLTLSELDLTASCDGEPMLFEVKHDRDAFKEIWLRFENADGKFPLYPGDSTTIEYHYAVTADKWGKWWQRAIRVPTERLSIELVFPASVDPMLWGLHTSMTAERLPVQPAMNRKSTDGRVIYTWSTHKPVLHSRFRFEWRFRVETIEEQFHLAPSERMQYLGITQRGDPILVHPCTPFVLPAEADIAHETGKLLVGYLEPLAMVHEFGKGMGLAASQIGIPRSAAVVRLPHGKPRVLFNPRIKKWSEATDERFEGCLSFFDVRGKVRRALSIEIEHTDLHGRQHREVFKDAAARHWQHEIDHLNGILYIDRMDDPAAELVPVEEYGEIGSAWDY